METAQGLEKSGLVVEEVAGCLEQVGEESKEAAPDLGSSSYL